MSAPIPDHAARPAEELRELLRRDRCEFRHRMFEAWLARWQTPAAVEHLTDEEKKRMLPEPRVGSGRKSPGGTHD